VSIATKIHPCTGLPPGLAPAPAVRTGGASGRIGYFGPTRRLPDGRPRQHEGVDWLLPLGAPVYAAHEGVLPRPDVEQALGAGYGYRIYLRSTEDATIETLYAHLSTVFVSTSHPGQIVRRGQCVGLAGRSGNTGFRDEDLRDCPTHLHFGVRLNTPSGLRWIDPLEWLEGA